MSFADLRKGWPYIAVLLVTAGVYLAGGLEFIESRLADARFAMLDRPATGNVVLVVIDEPSLKELDIWPWPRRYHARAIERLHAAGAKAIVLDLDLGAPAGERDDARLEAALAAANGRVVLPAFRRLRRNPDGSESVLTVAPIARLARHAALADFALQPEADGLVRRMYVHSPIGGRDDLPTLPALLTGFDLAAGDSYYIDFGIRAKSIPWLSYADVLKGRFERSRVAGKIVLIGATLSSFKSIVAVPVQGSLPGIVVQALAIESIVQGRALARPGALPILFGALLLAWVALRRFGAGDWRRVLAIAAAMTAGVAFVPFGLQYSFPLLLDTAPWLMVILVSFAVSLAGRVDEQAVRLIAQAMRLRRQDVLLGRIADNTFDGLMTFDEDGTVRFFNAAATRIFGYAADEVIGRNCAMLFRDPEAKAPFAPDFLAPGTHEVRGRHKDGTRPVLDLAVATVEDNDRRHFVILARDITDRRRAETALVAALEEAELANRAKTDFLATMSHELRTPLNAIIGFSEIMADDVLGPVGNPKYKEYATDIHKSGVHLLAIIGDILDMARIEAGRFELVENDFDVERAIRSCLRMVSDRAQAGQVGVELEIASKLPALFADERVFKQIVLNLASNAIKFTPEGGRVAVSAKRARGGALEIAVTDTGIGIARRNLAKVLEPFAQVEGALSRSFEGAGLGLPLAKRFAERHGGSFKLRSKIGEGTTATVRFPAWRCRGQQKKPKKRSRAAAG